MRRLLPLVLLALATACSSGSASTAPAKASGPVTVAPVTGLAAVAVSSCAALHAALPKELADGIAQRVTTPGSDTTAAWGDPAITLRCGVPVGSEQDEPYVFSDIAWALHDDGASRRWTTRDRKVNIAVVVPDAYDGQAELLVRLGPAIMGALGTPAPAPGS